LESQYALLFPDFATKWFAHYFLVPLRLYAGAEQKELLKRYRSGDRLALLYINSTPILNHDQSPTSWDQRSSQTTPPANEE
jgi:hypothetical protein